MIVKVEINDRTYKTLSEFCLRNKIEQDKFLSKILDEKILTEIYGDINEKIKKEETTNDVKKEEETNVLENQKVVNKGKDDYDEIIETPKKRILKSK